MSKKYYIQNMWLGFFFIIIYCVSSWSDIASGNDFKWFFFTLANSVLFPFAKFIVECIALKYTDRSYWNTGILFGDGVPKIYAMTFYYFFIFVLSLPLGIFCIGYMCLRKNK